MQLSLMVMCCTAAVMMSPAAELPLKIKLHERAGRAEVTFKKKRVILYSFDRDQFKPYVKELQTLAGENILLDGPADASPRIDVCGSGERGQFLGRNA